MPWPIANSQITLATPTRMPRTVSSDRSGCSRRLRTPIRQAREPQDAHDPGPRGLGLRPGGRRGAGRVSARRSVCRLASADVRLAQIDFGQVHARIQQHRVVRRQSVADHEELFVGRADQDFAGFESLAPRDSRQ